MLNKLCILCLLWLVLLARGVEAIDSFTECDCPGATLSCIRDDARNSTNGKCPPCPTSCPTLVDECRSSSCSTGKECVVGDDAVYRCVAEIAEGGSCSYIKNCVDCPSLVSGERREELCSGRLFCRVTSLTTDCVVKGMCVRVGSAESDEASCLRDGSDDSRCSADGKYLCSTTKTRDNGVTVQTCYNTDTGLVIRTNILDDTQRNGEVDCRGSLDTCTSISNRVVLSGEKVDDPNNRCSYCLCNDGVIDTTKCVRKPNCSDNPADCTYKEDMITHGDTVTAPGGCIQMRCKNGRFEDTSLDKDCDGKDDIDICAGQVGQPIVCAKKGLIRARVPRCIADSADSFVNTDCDEIIVCGCQRDEYCVGDTRPLDLCIDLSEGSGCKSHRCVKKSESLSCDTSATNQPVCSSSGTTYASQCEAIVNTDYDIKYLRACDDVDCVNDNSGEGFCGYDKRTYSNLCELERITGNTMRDYDGTCVTNVTEARTMCKDIPTGCVFTTVASDAACPVPGGQGILPIDQEEVSEYALRKGKDEMDLNELVSVAESDWKELTGFPLKDDTCEFMSRAKYDTVGSLVVSVMAERGENCNTCGDRLRTFVDMIRETKSVSVANGGNRKRRQTDGSGSSGIFISPSELANDPLFHNGAYSIIASAILILTNIVLVILL